MAAASSGPGLLETAIMGSKHQMYLYSHLGYGLMAGRGKMLGVSPVLAKAVGLGSDTSFLLNTNTNVPRPPSPHLASRSFASCLPQALVFPTAMRS